MSAAESFISPYKELLQVFNFDWACFARCQSSTSIAPCSLHLTPFDYFLWCYIKDHVFLSPMTGDVTEWQGRITNVFASIECEILGLLGKNLILELKYAMLQRVY